MVKDWVRGGLLGAGGFGQVYLAFDKERHGLFAVKQVRQSDFSWGGINLVALYQKQLQSSFENTAELLFNNKWDLKHCTLLRDQVKHTPAIQPTWQLGPQTLQGSRHRVC